jgi:hypothetical protein
MLDVSQYQTRLTTVEVQFDFLRFSLEELPKARQKKFFRQSKERRLKNVESVF